MRWITEHMGCNFLRNDKVLFKRIYLYIRHFSLKAMAIILIALTHTIISIWSISDVEMNTLNN